MPGLLCHSVCAWRVSGVRNDCAHSTLLWSRGKLRPSPYLNSLCRHPTPRPTSKNSRPEHCEAARLGRAPITTLSTGDCLLQAEVSFLSDWLPPRPTCDSTSPPSGFFRPGRIRPGVTTPTHGSQFACSLYS